MSYKIEIQNNFFVVTDTTTGIEEIREVRDQVKWRVSGSIYSFFYNIANLVDQNSPNIIRLGENAKEFDFSEIVDSTETPFASRAIFNDLLNVNLGKIIQLTSATWGFITGNINDQTDLVTILNSKFDDPTGDTTQYIAGDGTLITFPVSGQAGTLVREVRNTTGATLTKGTIVYINGAQGNKPTVAKALATSDATSAQTFGFLQSNIANNSNGFIIVMGDLIGLDTSGITEGTQLYLSSAVAGTYTTTKQVAPAHLVYVGIVTRSHPTQGQIEVKIQNGYELDELHDVLISGETDGQVLQFEGASGLWKNKTLATGLTVGSTAISSGTDGRVLFQNGGVLQQSANFFWDNTNSRLGVGTSSPSSPLHISKGGGARINFGDSQNTVSIGSIEEIGDSAIGFFTQINNEKMRINSVGNVGIGTSSPTARLDIRAQGALSTDIAFRVRNSANTADLFSVLGNGTTALTTLVATNTINISQPAGQYYPTLSFSNNGGVGQGSIFGYNSRLCFSSSRITPGNVLSVNFAYFDANYAQLEVLAKSALSTDNAFGILNNGITGYHFRVNNAGNVLVGVGGLSIQRTDSPTGSLLGTFTYQTSGVMRCDIPFEVSGTYGRTGFANSQVALDLQYAQANLRCFGGAGNTGFTFNTISATTGMYFMRLQNGGNDFLNISSGGGFIFTNTAVGSYAQPVASAKVQIDSTTQGFLPPRMTNAQRTAIASPAVGLMVYCTDATEGLYIYKSTGWTFVI
jgi:hypothetical protein